MEVNAVGRRGIAGGGSGNVDRGLAGLSRSSTVVTVKGHVTKTNSKGTAKISLPGSGKRAKLKVTAPTYQVLTKSIKL